MSPVVLQCLPLRYYDDAAYALDPAELEDGKGIAVVVESLRER